MELERPSAELPDHTALPDVSDAPLIELLQDRDPELLAALARLTEIAKDSAPVTFGWNSAIVR